MLSINDPTVTQWSFTCFDPKADNKPAQAIMVCTADTQNLASETAMVSAITEYGKNSGKLIGCRWNILMPNHVYFLTPAAAKSRVKLTLGSSKHPMRLALEKLIGDTPAFAIRTVMSPPAAAQTRAYFA